MFGFNRMVHLETWCQLVEYMIWSGWSIFCGSSSKKNIVPINQVQFSIWGSIQYLIPLQRYNRIHLKRFTTIGPFKWGTLRPAETVCTLQKKKKIILQNSNSFIFAFWNLIFCLTHSLRLTVLKNCYYGMSKNWQ